MPDRSDDVDSIAQFLEARRKKCIADGNLLLEANADALQRMASTAPNWPHLTALPPVYQQTLHRLVQQNGTKVGIKKAHEGEIIAELFAAAKQVQNSVQDLESALAKYGPRTFTAFLSMISMVMSVECIFRRRSDDKDALKAIEDFILSLDEKSVVGHLHRIAGDLIHFEPQSSPDAGK